MTRVKLDGFTLEKRWHGRVLQEIKDHKPVERSAIIGTRLDGLRSGYATILCDDE